MIVGSNPVTITQKTAVIDNDRPKRLNAAVAKKKYRVVGHWL